MLRLLVAFLLVFAFACYGCSDDDTPTTDAAMEASVADASAEASMEASVDAAVEAAVEDAGAEAAPAEAGTD